MPLISTKIIQMAYKDPKKRAEWQRAYQARRRAAIKIKVLAMFNNCCGICGFDDVRALQLDHRISIKRTGNERGMNSGGHLWRQVANGTIPQETMQLLCANCHAIKTHTDFYA